MKRLQSLAGDNTVDLMEFSPSTEFSDLAGDVPNVRSNDLDFRISHADLIRQHAAKTGINVLKLAGFESNSGQN